MAKVSKKAVLTKADRFYEYYLTPGILSQLIRVVVSWESGIVNKVGINTFVDPRLERGRINDITTEDTVEVIYVSSLEYLFSNSLRVDIPIVRVTSIYYEGNLTLEKSRLLSMLSIAQSVKDNK